MLIKFVYSILFLFLLVTPGSARSVRASKFGFTGIDDTAILKLAINSHYDTIIIDKQPAAWVIGPLRFNRLCNKVLLFESGTLIKAKNGAFLKTTDALLAFYDAENIQLLGNEVILQMNKHEYTDGEWRHGISLRNCKDISISNLTIKDTGGDGIYIAGNGKGTYSENIVISQVTSSNNKRQGMSVISVKNLQVSHSIFENTIGTLPGAGVDLEPNTKEDRLEQIEFTHCIFRNNDHSGIVLALGKLEIDSYPVTISFKNCVLQNNHNKENKYAAGEIIFNAHKTLPVKGTVLFENCIIENSNWGLFYSRKIHTAYIVTFKDCTARNISLNKSHPVIYLEVPDYREGAHILGGYHFENLFIAYDANVPFFEVRGSHWNTLSGVADITGNITFKNKYSDVKQSSYINYNPANNINVNLRVTQVSKPKN